jgi:radial spoke head protein 1
LIEPTGVYEGQFVNGRKQGYGIYKYNNGLRYEGEYKNNVRQGNGKILNPNNNIAYEGHF